MTEREWLASEDAAAMLQLITGNGMGSVRWRQRMRIDRPSDRKLRLFACACSRAVWHLLTDQRSRKAVEVAERFADGGATGDELDAASDAAWAAWDIANAAAIDAASDAAWGAWGATMAAASDAASDATWDAARQRQRQASLLRDIVGDPFRSAAAPPGPTCITPDVLSLAQAAYDERLEDGTLDPFRLALLADALEEAGCDDDTLLSHLRGQEAGCDESRPHCRGCWAVDLIMGRG